MFGFETQSCLVSDASVELKQLLEPLENNYDVALIVAIENSNK